MQARPDGPKPPHEVSAAPATVATHPAPAGSNPAAPSRVSPRTLLIAALTLAALWWIALGTLAFFTANPVTLNREQILRSDYVVTGTVLEANRGNTVEVQKEWKQERIAGTIAVRGLNETGARPGRAYIIPIEKEADGTFRVTPSRMPNAAPLIYPATNDAAAQLSRLLSEGAPAGSSSTR